jgi:hypothetical protein
LVEAEVPAGGELQLNALAAGTIGLTPAAGESLAEAAYVCLEDQKHASGAILNVDGAFRASFKLTWDAATAQMRRCWADPDEATELGACGIAALIVKRLTDLNIVYRSRKTTGFDYWLGPDDDDGGLLFQGRTKLEVSGIRSAGDAVVSAREKRKIRQVRRFEKSTPPPLPAIIVVVEFGSPRSRTARL